MVRETIPTDIGDLPEVARLAHEVAASGVRRALIENGTVLAVVTPARPRRRRRKREQPLSPADRDTIRAAIGAWEDLVDAEQLKRDLDAARGDNGHLPAL